MAPQISYHQEGLRHYLNCFASLLFIHPCQGLTENNLHGIAQGSSLLQQELRTEPFGNSSCNVRRSC